MTDTNTMRGEVAARSGDTLAIGGDGEATNLDAQAREEAAKPAPKAKAAKAPATKASKDSK